MPTKLEDAKIKIQLDTDAAEAQLNKLEEAVKKAEEKTRTADQKGEDKRREENDAKAKEQSNKEKAAGSRFGVNFRAPITGTLISAVGAIPDLGIPGVTPAGMANALRVGLNTGEVGPDVVKGFLKGALADEEGGVAEKVLDKALDTAFAPVGGMAGLISKLKSFETSFQPAFQNTLRVARASGLAQIPLDAQTLAQMFSENFEINRLQDLLQRRGRRFAMERMGEAVPRMTRRSNPQ